jgi:hypothetical protein
MRKSVMVFILVTFTTACGGFMVARPSGPQKVCSAGRAAGIGDLVIAGALALAATAALVYKCPPNKFTCEDAGINASARS